MRPELVIFDCDGVIADSEVLSALVLIEQLAKIGIPVTFADVRRDFLGRSFPTVAQTIRDRFGTPLPDDFEARYRATLLARFEKDLVPTPGLRDLLDRIDLPICVATSSSPPRVRPHPGDPGTERMFRPACLYRQPGRPWQTSPGSVPVRRPSDEQQPRPHSGHRRQPSRH